MARAVTLCAAVLLGSSLAAVSGSDTTSYGLVVDAGSSGSRIWLFSWAARESTSLLPSISTPVQVAGFSSKVTPGVSTAAGRNALNTLVNYASGKLNALKVPLGSVPIFLKATAGMRLLSTADRAAAMAEVRSRLAESPFQFQDDWAFTSAGEEEGLMGWLSVQASRNRLLGIPAGAATVAGPATLGALDLGGASTQITFMPPKGVDMLAGQVDIRLSPAIAPSVYTHSYLYYGQDEASVRMRELAVLDWVDRHNALPTPNAVLPNPCFPVGYTGTSGPWAVPFDSAVAGGRVWWTGTGDVAGCRLYAEALMHKGAMCQTNPKVVPVAAAFFLVPNATNATMSSAVAAIVTSPTAQQRLTVSDWMELFRLRNVPAPGIQNADIAPPTTCAIGGEYMAPVDAPDELLARGVPNVTFLAFSAFSYAFEATNTPLSGLPLQVFRDNVAAFCSTPAAGLTDYYPASAGPFQQNYCMYAVYAYTLLVVGYGLDVHQPGRVLVAPSSESLSWALGSMYYDVALRPYTYVGGSGDCGGSSSSLGGSSAAVMGLAITLGCVLLVGGYCLITPDANCFSARTTSTTVASPRSKGIAPTMGGSASQQSLASQVVIAVPPSSPPASLESRS